MTAQTSAPSLHPRSLLQQAPAIAPNYPFNHWWIVGQSSEIGRDKILSRRVLGFDVALYRKEDGTAVAVEDRCAHRGLPLSLGWLEGDNVVCRYHGFRYAPDGKCQKIPTQEKIPAKTAVRTFRVVENAPFLWIWTGTREPESGPPDYPFLRDEKWVHALGYTHIAANYMTLKENVLDLTHFPYAHKSTFAMDDDYNKPPRCTFEGGIVTFYQEFLDQALPPYYAEHCGLVGRAVDRFDQGSSLSPAEHMFTARIVNKNAQPGEEAEYFVKFLHMTTPESPTTMHYWWVMARDHGLGPAAVKWMTDVNGLGFDEDKEILEAIQTRVNASGGIIPEVSVLADQAGLQTRRQLQALLDKDAG